ncbi:hypothetical protein LEP1GSC029_3468 [Leptospira interrogans str. 2002000626]|uniref:Uncharacterized protein n=1 Tax=Leptospira interrogans str. 2002000626 TaxID=996803 RepID=A0A829D208_LEPIR|nr:hypothetical protein LEP1GSC029_3468 [Leptospira interrogans str. 2002000626]
MSESTGILPILKRKNAPSPDAFPTAEDANLTQVERAKLIQEKNESDFLRKGLH